MFAVVELLFRARGPHDISPVDRIRYLYRLGSGYSLAGKEKTAMGRGMVFSGILFLVSSSTRLSILAEAAASSIGYCGVPKYPFPRYQLVEQSLSLTVR